MSYATEDRIQQRELVAASIADSSFMMTVCHDMTWQLIRKYQWSIDVCWICSWCDGRWCSQILFACWAWEFNCDVLLLLETFHRMFNVVILHFCASATWMCVQKFIKTYLINCLGQFNETCNFGALGDRDKLVRFWGHKVKAVSYTHLTLPTILRV